MSKEVWSYQPDVPYSVLIRHVRRAEWIMSVGYGANLLMFSAMLQMILSDPGWWREFWVWVCICSVSLALPMIIPAIIANVWAVEAARCLHQRHRFDGVLHRIERAPGVAAMKILAYAAGLILVVNFIEANSALRAITVALVVIGGVLTRQRTGGAERRMPRTLR